MKKKILSLILASLLLTGCEIEIINNQSSSHSDIENTNINENEEKPNPIEEEKDEPLNHPHLNIYKMF